MALSWRLHPAAILGTVQGAALWSWWGWQILIARGAGRRPVSPLDLSWLGPVLGVEMVLLLVFWLWRMGQGTLPW